MEALEFSNLECSYKPLMEFKYHPMAVKYTNSTANVRAIIKGNQGGGTAVTTMDAIHRFLGTHPVKDRNRIEAPIRFVSKTLPESPADEENQQYVEFKRRFPAEFIKKDITHRDKIVVVRDPAGGSDKKAEFMAKTQEIDAFMSVQRQAIYQDEEIERSKWTENKARLAIPKGDVSITLTPVRGLDWTYDEIWRRARKIERSKIIADKFGLPEVEKTGWDSDIEIFCWATDDNPMIDPAFIDTLFGHLNEEHDADELSMRRYGVFRQVTGRIYKLFDRGVHVIPWDEYWDAKRFSRYWHCRMVDYHQSKPWYVSWVAISPENEWFVWNEMKDRDDTELMREKIKEASLIPEDHALNRRTIFDPLAKEEQSNSPNSMSMFDYIQQGPKGLRMCETADTKSVQGRNTVMQRLRNSLACEKPYNNETDEMDNRFSYHKPTLWFFDTCKGHIDHFANWRTVEPVLERTKHMNDEKKIMQKWSDYCRNLEFLGVVNPVYYDIVDDRSYEGRPWFRSRRN